MNRLAKIFSSVSIVCFLNSELAFGMREDDERQNKPLCSLKSEEPTEHPTEAGIPKVALGYEDTYKRFLSGRLVYRPNEESDAGRIELRIADLANPLEGTFDLSKCGDAGKYLSISTGYRKGKKPENDNKVEIWLTPRFLIEKNLEGDASHFKDIMGSWDATAHPLGTFFTAGTWNNLSWYDHATHSYAIPPITDYSRTQKKWMLMHENSLYRIRTSACHRLAPEGNPYSPQMYNELYKVFFVIYDELN